MCTQIIILRILDKKLYLGTRDIPFPNVMWKEWVTDAAQAVRVAGVA